MRVIICLGPILAVLLSGCNRSDGERLANIGTIVSHRAEALLPEKTPLSSALTTHLELENRIKERIKNDSYLTGEKIEIHLEHGKVILRGSVDNDILRQRTLELATSTVGVEKVLDELQVTNK